MIFFGPVTFQIYWPPGPVASEAYCGWLQAVDGLEPYGPDTEILKEECINHAHKRMGTALLKLMKGQKLGERPFHVFLTEDMEDEAHPQHGGRPFHVFLTEDMEDEAHPQHGGRLRVMTISTSSVFAEKIVPGHPLVRFSGRKRTCKHCARQKTKSAMGRYIESCFGCSACKLYLSGCFAIEAARFEGEVPEATRLRGSPV